jgi:hypothetical protein
VREPLCCRTTAAGIAAAGIVAAGIVAAGIVAAPVAMAVFPVLPRSTA